MNMWTQFLTAQPGDFSAIAGLLTQQNGEALESIYSFLESEINQTGESMADLIQGNIAVNCSSVAGLNPDSLSTLGSLGLVTSVDNLHVSPTQLGWAFIQAMRATEPT